jgi:hypothetical protein
VSDTASRLLSTQRTRLSDERGAVVSMSRLLLRQMLDSATTDASDAGNLTIGEVARRDTWQLYGAIDVAVASVGLATDCLSPPKNTQ